ncbi:branched-chain amino acid transport system II carrier protein [Carnobacterium divergens]|uniref:branched-chain amino acid transport system II carrier protein n=1 Tax=Carnobacterium divergens TaxID=2748 RepID=UPI00107180BD|nr:branched-chain amino acid transport system II carrier protein [Carnobacterium divergens]MDT1996553.1 branched-chain amino acid transport system II carrier protein [Carnobacterium divergens]TFI65795.1 branched-chain amino acid transport system II carrier protein [Carnobacterium divergens]TFI65900.1 branched-chain amino acid transport system II carrier protein [Carnobacterium divergens]TFI69673.1 branched-chain amino acid transport system II carrier protein [Carnobacterium divergens]TFI80750.
MDKRLSLSSYIFIGSMLFGLFFGAGNLIFPVHLGQEAGVNVGPATLGFLITGIGLPFLGVVAIGVSKSDGLFDLASRVHPLYGMCMTVLLYLTIGPFFALPRTGTVSYEIGIAPFISSSYHSLGLIIFTIIFFGVALIFSMKPTKILMYVGKILNPLFLVFLGVLIVTAFIKPMGSIQAADVHGAYVTNPFFKGFTEGYNTMDALASLAFGIIVVQTIKGLGVHNPRNIALDTLKSGTVSLILMGIIYGSLTYIGAMSVGKFKLSDNGGVALAQIADYYFGSFGSILLAIIVTVACLKTAIGLISACSETFHEMFPKFLSYKQFVVAFTLLACGIANVGLTNIITLSIPVLMFLYPLAITLILLGLLSPLFKNRQIVYVLTTIFTIFVSFADGLNAMPESIRETGIAQGILSFYTTYLPLFDIGMGWVLPAIVGLVLGWMISIFKKNELRF